MFSEIFRFELRYQLRQPVFLIGCAVFFLMPFLATTTDAVVIGGSLGQVHRNAPFVLMQLHLLMSLLGIFFVAAFVASSVVRDAQHRTEELFLTLPIHKAQYLLGRFTGALVAALLTGIPVSLGVLAGSLMPWLDPERLGPFAPGAYLFSLVGLYAPNVVLVGCVLFAIATPSRSLLLTYGGVVGILVGYTVAGTMAADVSNARAATLLDPLGVGAFEVATRYWTVFDRNQRLLALDGAFLASRALWLAVALTLLAFTYWRFRFTLAGTGRRGWWQRRGWLLRRSAARALAAGDSAAGLDAAGLAAPGVPSAAAPVRAASAAAPSVFDRATTLRQLAAKTRLEVGLVVRSLAFPILVAFGIFNVIGNSGAIDEMFGTPVYPVTHLMVQILESASLFLIVIVIFYSGELVARERALDAADTLDALPVPDWVQWTSKLLAFVVVLVALLVVSMLTGIGIQAYHGYHHFELGLYLRGILVGTGSTFLLAGVLAFFLQVATHNRYLGYLLMIVYLVGVRALGALDFDHHLYRYGTTPNAPYSDLNGYGPFVEPLLWFNLYWALGAALLVVGAHLLWIRGRAEGWRTRLRLARLRFHGPVRLVTAAVALGMAAVGSWIFYNTNVLNEYVPDDVARDRQARYEKTYKRYESLPQPRIRAVSAEVDIYPERRAVDVRGRYRLENPGPEPIAELHLRFDPQIAERTIELAAAELASDDRELGYAIYRLDPPLPPGGETELRFEVAVRNRGFRNSGEDTRVVGNGTFFNNFDYFPTIGYSSFGELEDPNRRRQAGLPPIQRMPDLDDPAGRERNYLSAQSDWIELDTVVSTRSDQIALAPGELVREWSEGDRRFFHYRTESPVIGFFAYLSGDWEVRKDRWNDVAIEVYHHPDHAYNVPRMIDGVKKTLEYLTRELAPYPHRHVRIVEFPRYARFAQALPGTIPFSESIGFIARLDDDEEEPIDYVFYVTAHEVAHQWWAHQVIGGFVQGATVLSETLSQYSALMVMEQEYGREHMRRFLRYELDRYLRSRGSELIEELPLHRVENQGYVHYAKGSLAMYALRDAIGEEALNAALRRFHSEAAFQEPPYTTTRELLAHLRAAVPPEHEGLLVDLFETITLWDNVVRVASAEPLPDGRFVVRLEVESRKLRGDGRGNEAEIPVGDWVDVAVFGEKTPGSPASGEILALEKRRLEGETQTLELVVGALPLRAGIDPFHKLIDRNPEDNVVEVELASTSPQAEVSSASTTATHRR